MSLSRLLAAIIILFSSCGKNNYKAEFKDIYPIISPSSYLILESREHGMFSIMDDVISLCYAYEKGDISGFEVDFGTSGLYYDAKKGPNWFSYYFEPLQVGENLGQVIRTPQLPYRDDKKVQKLGLYALQSIEYSGLARAEINILVQKYLKIKPELNDEIDRFLQANFTKDYMVGIHYRGTDKTIEAPRTPYQKVNEAILNVMNNQSKNKKIFVATDEEGFINYMKNKYDNICYQDAIRSVAGKPVHFNNQDPYKAGKEAIMDSILLSKTNYLIRTSSNLSRWSMYFNPHVEVFELSQRW